MVYKYNGYFVKSIDIIFDEACFQVDVLKTPNSKKHLILSLTHTHRLLFDGREYCNIVSSYFIHTDFLLFTTLRQSLVCVPFESEPLEEIKREDFSTLPSINFEDTTKSAGK